MLVLKLPVAVFGCRDCDIVNFCCPFVADRAGIIGCDFQEQNGKTRIVRMKRGGTLLNYWYGAVCTVGLGFGLLGERRPFGQNILAHPFIVYAFLVAAGPPRSPCRTAAPGAGTHSGTRARPGMRRGSCPVSGRELHRRSRGRSLTKRLRRRRVHDGG